MPQSSHQRIEIAKYIGWEILSQRDQVHKDIVHQQNRIRSQTCLNQYYESLIPFHHRNSQMKKVNDATRKLQESYALLPKEEAILKERVSTLSTIEKKIMSDCREYARLSSLALTSTICNTLPRELRDLIYTFYFATNGRSIYENKRGPRKIVDDGLDGLQNAVSADIVGEQVFGEMRETLDIICGKAARKVDRIRQRKKGKGQRRSLDA